MMTSHGRKGLDTMKRITIALAFALLTVFGGEKIASAQEILLEGPLAGQPAVRKLVEYRRLRFSVGPQFAYTLLNNYEHNFLVGAKLDFNILEWLSIGAVGYYSFNAPTKLTQYISDSTDISGQATTPAASNFPSYGGSANFEDQVALLKGEYLFQLSLVPFRGKMSMFEKLFVAIDGSIFLGGGMVQLNERKNCSGRDDTNGDGVLDCGTMSADGSGSIQRVNRIAGTFTAGIGFMAYFNDWFALNLEYRVTPFKWNEGGTDEAGSNGKKWSVADNDNGTPDDDTDDYIYWKADYKGNGDYPDGKINDKDRTWNANQSIALGFIFYFPLHPRITE